MRCSSSSRLWCHNSYVYVHTQQSFAVRPNAPRRNPGCIACTNNTSNIRSINGPPTTICLTFCFPLILLNSFVSHLNASPVPAQCFAAWCLLISLLRFGRTAPEALNISSIISQDTMKTSIKWTWNYWAKHFCPQGKTLWAVGGFIYTCLHRLKSVRSFLGYKNLHVFKCSNMLCIESFRFRLRIHSPSRMFSARVRVDTKTYIYVYSILVYNTSGKHIDDRRSGLVRLTKISSRRNNWNWYARDN